jgi:heparan-alpha-glucosaminide N-acetyltransferase
MMTQDPPPPRSTQNRRLLSLDTLRGLTILVMIFVNDVAGVEGTPAWMKHIQPPGADGMTFVDVVFPAFLFIVGTSIPFAIGARLRRGQPLWQVWSHILLRTVSLLVLGVLMVNEDQLSERSLLSKPVWSFLLYFGAILVWNGLPSGTGPKQTLALLIRSGGMILLIALALLFRGQGQPRFIELTTQWWGILGLIGWAYLVACLIYVPFRNNLAGVVGMIPILLCLRLAESGRAFGALQWLNDWVSIGSALGAHASITVAGVALGMMLQTPDRTPRQRARWGFWFGVALAVAGYLTHSAHNFNRVFIINKIGATIPWCLWCSAIAVWIWVAIYTFTDLVGWKRWTILLAPAGQNPLLAYLLAPLLYAAFDLIAQALQCPNYYDDLGEDFFVGFWRSVGFALFVTFLAGGLRRAGVQLRL